jgi:hypothetical protein
MKINQIQIWMFNTMMSFYLSGIFLGAGELIHKPILCCCLSVFFFIMGFWSMISLVETVKHDRT